MDDLKVMTVRQLAEHIASQINLDDVLKTDFPTCDYGTIDTDGETAFDREELDFLHTGVCGWFGIKRVDTGFNSIDLVLIADYYGGSCAHLAQLCDGVDLESAKKEILQIILGSMNVLEVVSEDTTLLVEFYDGGDK